MKHFSLTHRILHWLIAIVFSFLILTVFLRLTWMNKNNMAAIITEGMNKIGTTISQDDAFSIAKNIRSKMFEWHIYAGYLLIWLYVIRMIHLAVAGISFPNPFAKREKIKHRIQGLTYIVFYILLGCSLVTGILMIKGPENWGETMEEIHVKSLYYVIAFIVMHLGGIVIGELTDAKGVVSRMINGK